MRIGFTGHQGLPEAFVAEIQLAIQHQLEQEVPGLVGISSLAEGGDQLFASTVLTLSGELEIIVPCRGYETTFSSEALARFHDLLHRARTVSRLAFDKPSEEAYLAAGMRVVDDSEQVIAVWDGKAAKGLGGTADVVRYAEDCGKRVTVIWPEGATR